MKLHPKLQAFRDSIMENVDPETFDGPSPILCIIGQLEDMLAEQGFDDEESVAAYYDIPTRLVERIYIGVVPFGHNFESAMAQVVDPLLEEYTWRIT
jgi:hypothetical protein